MLFLSFIRALVATPFFLIFVGWVNMIQSYDWRIALPFFVCFWMWTLWDDFIIDKTLDYFDDNDEGDTV